MQSRVHASGTGRVSPTTLTRTSICTRTHSNTHTHTLSRGCEHLSVALADYPNVVDLDLAFNGIMVLFHLDVS